jgi:hypothetical protein
MKATGLPRKTASPWRHWPAVYHLINGFWLGTPIRIPICVQWLLQRRLVKEERKLSSQMLRESDMQMSRPIPKFHDRDQPSQLETVTARLVPEPPTQPHSLMARGEGGRRIEKELGNFVAHHGQPCCHAIGEFLIGNRSVTR